ncbi:MAG: hypothetical protein QNJ51_00565 [Calothrix sp. MO_167.B12]|nr:hypothetical protein [Calothrix sp. MO_167.B12]
MTPTCQLSTVNCQHQKRPNLTGYSYIISNAELVLPVSIFKD